jgi:hypothetical protein
MYIKMLVVGFRAERQGNDYLEEVERKAFDER